ncbi:TPA: hypothetical protein ACH3X1_006918 [Trebouxia sp. C0004]
MQACIANSALRPSVSARQACRPARQARCMAPAGFRNHSSDRRSAGLMLVAFPALLAAPAFARDADKAKAAAEARKEALAKAAEEMRESGKTASAFSESQYAVSEDKSPNVHTRQEEGVRESAD